MEVEGGRGGRRGEKEREGDGKGITEAKNSGVELQGKRGEGGGGGIGKGSTTEDLEAEVLHTRSLLNSAQEAHGEGLRQWEEERRGWELRGKGIYNTLTILITFAPLTSPTVPATSTKTTSSSSPTTPTTPVASTPFSHSTPSTTPSHPNPPHFVYSQRYPYYPYYPTTIVRTLLLLLLYYPYCTCYPFTTPSTFSKEKDMQLSNLQEERRILLNRYNHT